MCMDFLLDQATDGTVMSGRTLEFGMEMKPGGIIRNVGCTFQSPAPDDTCDGTFSGKQWQSRYGYIGTLSGCTDQFHSDMMAALGADKFILQGMNTEGLSCGGLYLMESVYPQTLPEGSSENALHFLCFTDWVLGTCYSVADVIYKLNNGEALIWSDAQTQTNFCVHYSLFDKSGAAIVVEWINGELNIFHNPLRVCTNAPTFDWHLKNVQNYLNLSPLWPEDLEISPFGKDETATPTSDAIADSETDIRGLKIITTGKPSGSGYGMRGLPGDATPPSRLIRMFFLKNNATRAADVTDLRNLVVHFLNSTDLVKGDNWDKKHETADYTQLAMICDYTNQILYFRTYDNPQLREISLKDALANNPDTQTLEFAFDEDDVTDKVITGQIFEVTPTAGTSPTSHTTYSHAAQ